MLKSKGLIVAMVTVFLVIMAVNSNYVFADETHDLIIKNQRIIKRWLKNQVIPKLDECCGCPECECGVPKTGQTTSYETGDDGDLQMGIPWPVPRFTDNGDGTVTDNLTGLIWLKNADCFGQRTWTEALSDCNGLASGSCGLTDGSIAGDWRLPNRRELNSLVHCGFYAPCVPDTAGTGQWSAG